jgi:hypothetical protein
MKKSAAFSRGFLLLDTDIAWPQESCAAAEAAGLSLIGSKPCVEALLLHILDINTNWEYRSVKECKREFHAKYLDETQKLDTQRYLKHYTKSVLEEARKRIVILDQMLQKFTELQSGAA